VRFETALRADPASGSVMAVVARSRRHRRAEAAFGSYLAQISLVSQVTNDYARSRGWSCVRETTEFFWASG
jgi:hypothetical protein